MVSAALVILWLTSLYLAVFGMVMMFAPDRANRFLSAFAQTSRANLVEVALRFVAGLAFAIAAPVLSYPLATYWFGLFLAATALLFVVAPGLHRRFAARAVASVAPFLPLLGAASIALAILLAMYLD